jgi:ABC-type multidrug transport system fused ATPase/permease subunit
MSRGSVSYEVYLKYAKTSSLTAVGIALFLILAANGANVGSNFWLKRWADESSHRGVIDILFYLGIYAALGFTMSLLVILQVIIVWVYSAIRSARVLHEQMLQAIASARLQFFDITPLGRIMNRFSKDVYTVDEVLPRSFLSFFRTLFAVVSILIVISITTPLFLITILPMGKSDI